MATTMRTQSVY